MRRLAILTFLAAGPLLIACAASISTSPTSATSSAGALPTPASALIGRFVWQTDGRCGYRSLRPTQWPAVGSECGAYVLPGTQGQAHRLALQFYNYQVLDQQQAQAIQPGMWGMLPQYELFKRDSSLAGWTKGVEQMWKSMGIDSTLLSTLPQAKIYSTRGPSGSDLTIVALVIDQSQPLGLGLFASGAYANLDHIRSEHIWDDYMTMVNSLQAIRYDPANVTPALPGQ